MVMPPATSAADPRKTAAMMHSPPGDLQPDSPVLGPSPSSVPPSVLQATPPGSFEALDDDTVLLVLNALAQPLPHPRALARAAQCSRRLWRLAGSERLWLKLCRSAFPHSRLPTSGGTDALRRCYAERVALPLRLASELDRAIGGLQSLLSSQAAVSQWLCRGTSEWATTN